MVSKLFQTAELIEDKLSGANLSGDEDVIPPFFNPMSPIPPQTALFDSSRTRVVSGALVNFTGEKLFLSLLTIDLPNLGVVLLEFLCSMYIVALRFSENVPSVNKFLPFACEHFQVDLTKFNASSDSLWGTFLVSSKEISRYLHSGMSFKKP
ncbi:hypothetical protein AVEN_174496-1 [Araneus ventricosus]|uniref:Uncharacterized protein n=1 Tax=Araneus ventricosus TaxID=182803 RepID=A0A4Y2P4K0_ARAVE|nr:hypothetical protein AVEN_174496-1 [Araneus ventricosus]